MGKAIKVENLSKAYQLGDFGTGTISRDLERYWAKLWGKEDPFLKIGEINDRTSKGESDIVWSLKDINFEIEQGDAVGIIGRNGAGKSTLLKILSRVTSPTTGSIKVKGRIASLLEVGTGFHPELTGRENIYLNGAILGMRKAEIKRKFDEIVAFSGVERYIDTPVKRYSSGMYVRLAFAVAAHLESEILIVDEVLAVGDAEFQKKCLGKMNDISKGEGRTVLFVSHNMPSVAQLCKNCIVLNSGSVAASGRSDDMIRHYHEYFSRETRTVDKVKFVGPLSDQFNFEILDINNKILGVEPINISPSDSISLTVSYTMSTPFPYRLTLSIYCEGVRLFTMHDAAELTQIYGKQIRSQYSIPAKLLRPGIYHIGLGGHRDQHASDWVWNDNIGGFTILKEWNDELDSINTGLININPLGKRWASND